MLGGMIPEIFRPPAAITRKITMKTELGIARCKKCKEWVEVCQHDEEKKEKSAYCKDCNQYFTWKTK